MTKIFMPNADRLQALGYSVRLATVPAIFGPDHRLCRDHSRYIRDRAEGKWSTRTNANNLMRVAPPSRRTVLAAAHALAAWLRWCQDQSLDWKTVDYDDVLAFQQAMTSGAWPSTGRKLSAITANQRADEATAFLEWAGMHGLRSPFRVDRIVKHHPYVTSSSFGVLVRDLEVRVRRAKAPRNADFSTISHLPDAESLKTWLKAVKAQRGLAKYLAARFILESGARLEETVLLPVTAVPSQEALLKDRARGRSTAYVPLDITKGSVPRKVMVDIGFLLELREWIDNKRKRLVYEHYRRTGEQQSELLFVSDAKKHLGTPISRDTLYKVFKHVKPAPEKWHPHLGRHAYACNFILNALQRDAKAKRATIDHLGVDWVHSRGFYHLRVLQTNLGHVDGKTTELYLRWLITAVGLDDSYTSYLQDADEEVAV